MRQPRPMPALLVPMLAACLSLPAAAQDAQRAEVATAARKQGLDTTIVEALPTPLSRHLGDRVGEACSALYTRNGVTVRTGATLTQILGQDRVEALVLADGTIVPTDLVIVGIGAQPNSEWVEGSGLTVDNGVVCTSTGRAAERVIAELLRH